MWTEIKWVVLSASIAICIAYGVDVNLSELGKRIVRILELIS